MKSKNKMKKSLAKIISHTFHFKALESNWKNF